MNNKNFELWLKLLGNAWVDKDPKAAANLCADKFTYFEDPFEAPLTTKEEIIRVWKDVPKTQKNISYKYDIISVNKDVGVAHWEAKYTSKTSGKKVNLNGIFVVSLNNSGKCVKFQQWWNTK